MAYQTGSASDATDLMNKLQTFAAANGFTVDYYNGTTRFLSISRSTDLLWCSFYWDNVNTIAMYQALGYAGGYAETPWLQVSDSGNGSSTPGSTIEAGRHVSNIGAGPFVAYHFFAYTDPYAIHVVLEFVSGLYRHFAFGQLNKTGTWVGGAFVTGHIWNDGGAYSQYSIPHASSHSLLLDGGLRLDAGYSVDNGSGTLHASGLPGQAAGSKWGLGTAPESPDAELLTDRDGNARIRTPGGCRHGLALSQLGPYLPDLSNGFIPIIPFEVFYTRGLEGADGYYYLGRMANCGHIHLHGIDPAQELTVGADTWIAFPAVRKSNIGGINQESENMGIIYRKDV